MTMARADRLCAVVFFALGAAMLAGGWSMDRLEIRRIHPASFPGLVPLVLGGLLMVCAVLLWFDAKDDTPVLSGGSLARLGLTGVVCVIYAVLLVGWLPYWLATFVFVTGFALIFALPDAPERAARIRAGVTSLLLGAAVSGLVCVVFAEVFLVRLP